MKGRRKMSFGFLACALVALYCMSLVFAYACQKYLLFPGVLRFKQESAPSPQALGLTDFTETYLQTPDGERLLAWYAPPKPGKNLIIHYHGNGDVLPPLAGFYEALRSDGSGVLAVEWRGYGKSSGWPSQAGLQTDALAAYDFARAQGVSPNRIFLFGTSLGTGLAVWTASQRPVQGLILDSSYTSIADVAAARFWFFPTRWLLKDPMPACEWARRAQAPIFAAHGENDRVIPIRLGRALVDCAPGEKTFLAIPGMGHMVLWRSDLFMKMREWIVAHSAPGH